MDKDASLDKPAAIAICYTSIMGEVDKPTFTRIGDAPKVVLDIKPRITLEQANEIAVLVRELGTDDDKSKLAWPIGISQWKKQHTVRGGKWVSRTTRGVNMAEVTKTVSGENYPASDFLVVEDKEMPSTWHLQVKKHGKVDTRLIGAAWAALHGGYRGDKYEGPAKTKAIDELKALYKSMEMETPVSEAETFTMPPMNEMNIMTTFADLYAAQAMYEAVDDARELVGQFDALASNIIDSPLPNKLELIRALASEFVSLLSEKLGSIEPEPEEPETPEVETPMESAKMKEAALPKDIMSKLEGIKSAIDEILSSGGSDGMQKQEQDKGQEKEVEAEAFAESIDGASIALVEAEPAPDGGRRAPVKLDVVLIKPGWGNKRDGHYYPKETLARDARVFEGAKMYATDHKPGEKSVKTEVSRIERIKNFTDDGAPVAEVVVFEPDFAEMVRNRADAGLLNTLECSILASGQAKAGEVGGVKGKIVEAITAAQSVDWVTKAGAGGHAVNLAETEEPPTQEATPEQQLETEKVPVSTEEQLKTLEQSEAIVTLSEADVTAAVSKTNLPTWAREWLAEGEYHNETELTEAITRATERVKKATRSGQPFAQGESGASAPANFEELEKQRTDRFNQIMRSIGAREV